MSTLVEQEWKVVESKKTKLMNKLAAQREAQAEARREQKKKKVVVPVTEVGSHWIEDWFDTNFQHDD